MSDQMVGELTGNLNIFLKKIDIKEKYAFVILARNNKLSTQHFDVSFLI